MTAVSNAVKKQKKRGASVPKDLVAWVMLSPALLVVFGIIIFPAVAAVVISMTEVNLLNLAEIRFVGLSNFIAVLGSDVFYTALRTSLIWTFGNVGVQLAMGIIGALILNQAFKARGIFRGLVLLPWATPSVLVALMWMWILDPNLGLFNTILQNLGLQDKPVAWLSNTETALPTLMFIDIWQGIPFFTVMILAALQGVPKEQIEAAKIDGANAWQIFWNVVFPIILPTILITTILRLIWTANYFDLILILTVGGPANSTLTLPMHAYITAYRGLDFGAGTAIAVIQALLLSILIVLYMRRIRRAEIA